jgi:DsbC/DsbD-like thiol-disulfide interchange protein
MSLPMRAAPLLACLLLATPVAGQPVAGAAGAKAEVTLLDGWRLEDGSRIAAVEIRLADGWHTYWRVPGEAGIPPTFDWSGSRNLSAVAYEWPRPDVFESFGLQSYGYEDGVVLPVRLTPSDPSAPMDVVLDLGFGVCNDICMAEEARVTARLEPDAPAAGRSRIEAALAERARSADEAGVARVTCALAPVAGGHELRAEVTFAAAPRADQVAVLEAGQPDLWIGPPDSRTDGRTVTARARVAAPAGAAGPLLERRQLRVTVLDATRAIDIRGCEAPG